MTNHILIIIFAITIIACGGKKESTTSFAPPAKSETEDEVDHPGKALYKQHCSACHQQDGNGVPNMFPPLTESEYVNGDVKWLVSSLVKGLEGPITVKGVEYDNMMPAVDYLTDDEIANILTFLRSNFGNNSGKVSAEEVNKLREEIKKG